MALDKGGARRTMVGGMDEAARWTPDTPLPSQKQKLGHLLPLDSRSTNHVKIKADFLHPCDYCNLIRREREEKREEKSEELYTLEKYIERR